MKSQARILPVLLAASLVAGLPAASPALGAEKSQPKHHHDLRGVITKVEADKNQFEIQTQAGRIVLCVIDEKSTLKRGHEKIRLKDVRAGERARCHCAALRGNRHYSESLLLEEKKTD